jgi:hypothetical protein
MYGAVQVNRMIGQLRHLLAEIARNPNRRMSDFAFPADAGDPLPPFVPRSNFAKSDNADRSVAQERPSLAAPFVKKILSHVYTHLGKV